METFKTALKASLPVILGVAIGMALYAGGTRLYASYKAKA